MTDHNHVRLVLPGPVEVRREILDAQGQWMIGHRGEAFSELFARVEDRLKQMFLTQHRVYIVGSSGSGLWEGAVRNSVRDDRRVLHCVNGAFSERWVDVSLANGKQVDVISVDWGRAITPEMVAAALDGAQYDAVCVVHNETSTGVTNPIREIAGVVRQHEDTLLLVDTVSGFVGAELRVDDWGIDVALTSSQKAFALPPGLAFAAVSDRVLVRAREIEHRGFYFDFLQYEKHIQKHGTPSTPPVSLLFAADAQLEAMLAEGLENRWARHVAMRDHTIEWAQARGFGLFAEEGYRSPTVTTIANTPGIDVNALAAFMREERGFAIDRGYGKLKGQTFRIPHMGDMQPETLQEVLAGIDDFLARQ